MFSWLRNRRRRDWTHETIPAEWIQILEEDVSFYKHLPENKRDDFLTKLHWFVREKFFLGAKGMEVTDRVKVIIAAAAARLILYLDYSHYDKLTEIVVYPYDYLHPNDDDSIRFGEAHTWGVVVLSWEAVQREMERDSWHDTISHEFAHVLDVYNGSFNGTPQLRKRSDYKQWAKVMQSGFEALREGHPELRYLLGDYAAKNEAEFFAVGTEAYFGQPSLFQEIAPEVFEEFRTFYGWIPPEPAPEPFWEPLSVPVWMNLHQKLWT
ncbi:MAG: hypothetical protein EP343_26685 [Deltaproteobacteria bacterium]|nr:MAG: hypothetical protein EP343_26685 [Deltaproteobacteria bacterium]